MQRSLRRWVPVRTKVLTLVLSTSTSELVGPLRPPRPKPRPPKLSSDFSVVLKQEVIRSPEITGVFKIFEMHI